MKQNDLEVIYWCISICILFATVFYIARGPVNAVRVGRRLNNEQQKDNAKRNLFLTLFALRGSPLHYDFVRGLNQIDIVFEDVPSVLNAWHSLLTSLGIKEQANGDKNWEILRTNLLSAMAVHLGYKGIQQTDMLQNYYPEGHDNQLKDEMDFRKANLTFLKSGAAFHELIMEYMKNLPPAPNPDETTK